MPYPCAIHLRRALVALCVIFASPAFAQSPTPEQKAQIAPTGALRAAIVKIPFLAKQVAASDGLSGIAPDLAEEMARRLGVPYQPTAFASPNGGLNALRHGTADITFLAPTSERIAAIDFGPAFMEMVMTLLVPGSSPITRFADADQPGRKIVVYEKTAVEEALVKNMTKASVVRVPIFAHKQALAMLASGEADAFADLYYALMTYSPDLPGSRLLSDFFARNALAIGYAKERPQTAAYVRAFTETVVASGYVAMSIGKNGIIGAVAPGGR